MLAALFGEALGMARAGGRGLPLQGLARQSRYHGPLEVARVPGQRALAPLPGDGMQGTLAAAFPRRHVPGRAFAGGAAEAGETLRAPGSPGLPQGPFERPARARRGTPVARPPMGGRRPQGSPQWAAPGGEWRQGRLRGAAGRPRARTVQEATSTEEETDEEAGF